MDGRDVPPDSALGYVKEFENALKGLNNVKIATVSGRYYAMDRDNRWERITLAYNAIMLGEGEKAQSAEDAINASYAKKVFDEFVVPAVIGDYKGMKDGDAVLFANFRSDRAREIMYALADASFDKFERPKTVKFAAVVGMTEYSVDHNRFVTPIFPPEQLSNIFGEVVSKAGMTQLRIAETEKYAHVTFFFNGGTETVFSGEDRVLVPSPKVATYDLQPEMSAAEVTEQATERIRSGEYDVIILNFANCDMVGHTGVFSAAVKAVETVDTCVGEVVRATAEMGGISMITADHGNAEKMLDENGQPHTAHTTNLVPFILMDPAHSGPIALRDGCLGDVAPTVLNVMGIPQPAEMTGRSLAEGHDFGKDRKMLLIICDGWGLGSGDDGDAIHLADTPYWDSLLAEQSWSKLHASGEHVGLGSGKAGNSEAGHSNLGAGRCVMQDDVRLDAAVKDGSFKKNPIFLQAIEHAKKNGTALHLLAYLTYKSSHGCIDYPLAICEMARDAGLDQVFFHIIFDGRSTEPGSAPKLLAELDEKLDAIGVGRIVDGVGRGVALDRDKNYDKVKRAYDAMVDGAGTRYE